MCLGNLLLFEEDRKDVDAAEEQFRLAITTCPRYARAHLLLGFLLQREREDIDGAEAAFRRAIWANPGFPDSYRQYGRLLMYDRRNLDGAGELHIVVTHRRYTSCHVVARRCTS